MSVDTPDPHDSPPARTRTRTIIVIAVGTLCLFLILLAVGVIPRVRNHRQLSAAA